MISQRLRPTGGIRGGVTEGKLRSEIQRVGHRRNVMNYERNNDSDPMPVPDLRNDRTIRYPAVNDSMVVLC